MKTMPQATPALIAAALLLASPLSRATDAAAPAVDLSAEVPTELPTNLPTTLPATPSAATGPAASAAAQPLGGAEMSPPATPAAAQDLSLQSTTGPALPAASSAASPATYTAPQATPGGFAQPGMPRAATPGAHYATLDGAMFRDVAPGISKSPVWGDDSRGSYGAYTRLQAGSNNGQHTHSSDILIVVLSGAYLYEDGNGKRRVAAGDFIRIPAGVAHWSGGDPQEGALFYEESNGRFDMTPLAR